MLKEILGIEPQEIEEGIFIPSSSSLKVATKDQTKYSPYEFEEIYNGDKKIMVICTEEALMTMENGKKFKTGNQPIELFVPILNWLDAGFQIEVFTPTGQPVALEMWAFPEEDEHIEKFYNEQKEVLENPKSLEEFSLQENNDFEEKYIAVFIPGGHGALLGLPENQNLGKLLKLAHRKNVFILSICHGPGAFLAADATNDNQNFIFDGYKIAAFPDSADATLPALGYLPGKMTWRFNEELEKRGMEIVNSLPDRSTHVDRRLVTAAGPLAANDFGKLVVKEMMKTVKHLEQ